MGGRVVKGAVPVAGSGALLGAGYAAKKFGLIEIATWAWMWPTLVAVALLLCGLAVVVWGRRGWSIPLFVGAAVQAVGVVLYVREDLETPHETLWYTIGAILITLAVMAVVWLVSFLRARWLERRMVDGLSDATGVDPQELDKIRQNMSEALTIMRRAGMGRNAIYELPWFLVIGRPSAGKTVAIKESGLGLPVRRDWVKGVGGTYTCDFFFTNDLIFMDTPGRWVQEGANESAQQVWQQLLKLLRKNRGRRPLDGLVVVVPADDLMTKSERELEEQAANIREIIDLLHEELNFRFPVYLIVSKIDLVDGFTDFFWGVPAQRRHEILGWSNPDPNDVAVHSMIDGGFDRILKHLDRYRMEMLAKVAKRTRNRRLFLFTENFKQLRAPLQTFAETLFHDDPGSQTPIFRGFYVTSGMQGEGSPVSKALGSLARNLGLSGKVASASSDEEGSRSYFLLELFRELLVGDEGLVGRTALHWWKVRRRTALGVFLPAGLALLVLVLSSCALLLNRGLYDEIADEVPEIRAEIAALAAQPLDKTGLEARFDRTERLREYHVQLTNFNPFRRFGMRRAEDLAAEVYRAYREDFTTAVLKPTLERAETVSSAEGEICADRVEVFQSVVWLRLAERFDSSEANMAGFDTVWSGFDLEPEEAVELRSELLRQFRYLVTASPTASTGSLLAGFDVGEVAQSIHADCGGLGSDSALSRFATFQRQCGEVRRWSHGRIQECYDLLEKVTEWDQENTERYLRDIRVLKDSLEELKLEEPRAEEAYETLAAMDYGQAETDACVTRFATDVVPAIEKFAIRPEYLEECRNAVAEASSYQEKLQVRGAKVAEQNENLSARSSILREKMLDYTDACVESVLAEMNLTAVDYPPVEEVSFRYRREGCFGFDEPKPSRTVRASSTRSAPAPRRRAAASAAPSSSAPARPASTRSSSGGARPDGVFADTCQPPSSVSLSAWERGAERWIASYTSATSDPAMTEAMQEDEKAKVDAAVSGFGASFRKAWMSCLGRFELGEPEASTSVWLRSIGQAPEFLGMLDPVVSDYQAIAGAAAEPPLDAVTRTMTGFDRLVALQAALPEYTGMLARIADDLDRILGDESEFTAYRNAFDAGDPSNSIVAARRWVQTSVAPVAGGALVGVFEKPLAIAEREIGEDNLLLARWEAIRQAYATGFADRFPFDPEVADQSDAALVERPALEGLLGRESGLVRHFEANTDGVGPGARAWLERARLYAELLFKPGTDQLRDLRFTVEPSGAPAASDEKMGKKFRIAKATVSLAPGLSIDWEEDEDVAPQVVKLELFGEDASDTAMVKAWVQERRGWLKRTFGKDWEDADSTVAVDREGNEVKFASVPWAAVRVIAAGLPAEGIESENATLRYDIPWSWDDGEKAGTFTLEVAVTSDRLGDALLLLENGLPAPPAAVDR